MSTIIHVFASWDRGSHHHFFTQNQFGNSHKVIGKNRAISDVCLLCRDIEASLDFYQNKLGFKLRRRAEGFVDFDTHGIILALWDIAHFSVHVGYTSEDSSPASLKVMTAIELQSSDELDHMYADLSSRGVAFIQPPKAYPWNAYCAYFNDPDNNLWELYSWMGDPDDYHDTGRNE